MNVEDHFHVLNTTIKKQGIIERETKMLLEDLLFLFLVGGGSLFFVPYLIRLYKAVSPGPDPLKEAQKRLRIAEAEAAAAKLNHEAEKIYEHLYEDVLHDDTKQTNKRVE